MQEVIELLDERSNSNEDCFLHDYFLLAIKEVERRLKGINKHLFDVEYETEQELHSKISFRIYSKCDDD